MTGVQHVNSLEKSEVTESSFYPNPTSNHIFIDVRDFNFGTLCAFDLGGRKVLEMENVDFNSKINFNGLDMGVYLFNAYDQKTGKSIDSWIIVSQ
jgi:hypothetical protein